MTFRVIIEQPATLDIAAYGSGSPERARPLNAIRWVGGIEEAILSGASKSIGLISSARVLVEGVRSIFAIAVSLFRRPTVH